LLEFFIACLLLNMNYELFAFKFHLKKVKFQTSSSAFMAHQKILKYLQTRSVLFSRFPSKISEKPIIFGFVGKIWPTAVCCACLCRALSVKVGRTFSLRK
jgi:hypothetical protein